MIRINGKPAQVQFGLISCGDTHGLGDPGIRINGLPVAALGQLSLGHAGFPPTPIISTLDPLIRVNGIPVAAAGSVYAPHTNGPASHDIRLAVPII